MANVDCGDCPNVTSGCLDVCMKAPAEVQRDERLRRDCPASPCICVTPKQCPYKRVEGWCPNCTPDNCPGCQTPAEGKTSNDRLKDLLDVWETLIERHMRAQLSGPHDEVDEAAINRVEARRMIDATIDTAMSKLK